MEDQLPAISGCPSFKRFSFEAVDCIDSDDRFADISSTPLPPEDAEDDDFTFTHRDANGSPISADEIFSNGQIRTAVFPVFNRHVFDSPAGPPPEQHDPGHRCTRRLPLRDLMKEDRDPLSSSSSSECDELEGVHPDSYCIWKPNSGPAAGKSSSTGSSRRWRFHDLLKRSGSEGKERFLLLEKVKERLRSGLAEAAGKSLNKVKPENLSSARPVLLHPTKAGDRRRYLFSFGKDTTQIFTNG